MMMKIIKKKENQLANLLLEISRMQANILKMSNKLFLRIYLLRIYLIMTTMKRKNLKWKTFFLNHLPDHLIRLAESRRRKICLAVQMKRKIVLPSLLKEIQEIL